MQRLLEWFSSGCSAVGRSAAVLALSCCVASANDPASLKSGREPDNASNAGNASEHLLCVHGIDPGQSLPVRSGPGHQHPMTGRFAPNDCGIALAGACRGDWCDMVRNGVRGWVDTRFIGVYEVPRTVSSASDMDSAAAIAAPVQGPASVGHQPNSDPASRAALDQAQNHGARPDSDAAQSVLDDRRHGAEPEPPSPKGACVARVARGDTLRMRSGPGVGHNEIGGIPPGVCSIERVGGCRGA